MRDNVCSLLDSSRQSFYWSKLTIISPRVQPWVRGRSAGSFPEQRLVIEPRNMVTCHCWHLSKNNMCPNWIIKLNIICCYHWSEKLSVHVKHSTEQTGYLKQGTCRYFPLSRKLLVLSFVQKTRYDQYIPITLSKLVFTNLCLFFFMVK